MGEIRPQIYKASNGTIFMIRTAVPGDAEKVTEFTRTILGEAPYLLTSLDEFTITAKQQRQLLQDIHEDSGKLALLAEHESEVIGYLDFHNGHRKRIKHQGSFGMSVKKEARNQGVGTALVKILLQWAENSTLIEKICLDVFADNKHAIKLYKKFGFKEEGIKRNAIKNTDGTYQDMVMMAYFSE